MSQIIRTLVEKAVALREGESLCDFQHELSEAIRKHLNVGEYDCCYLEVVYENVLVVWRWVDITGRSDYIQFAYSRAAGDEFTFGDAVPVEPRLTFVPKS